MRQETIEVTVENYEEYLILQADGELNEAEEQALQIFLKQHPELEAEMDVYASLRLTPDETEVFADKASLLKPVPAQKKRIAMPLWSYGAAAAVALLAGLWIVNRTPERNNGNEIATVTPKKNTGSTTSIQKPVDTYQQPSVKTPSVIAAHTPATQSVKQLPTSQPTPQTQTVSAPPSLAALKPVGDVALESEAAIHTTATTVAIQNQPLPQPTINPVKENSPLLALLPVDEGKIEAYNTIKESVVASAEGRIQKVKQVRDDLKGTSLGFRLGNHDVFSINF